MQLTAIKPTAKGPADRFTGDVYVTPISSPQAPPYLASGIVHFAPAARTNWHVHRTGQTLHVLEGIALIGTRDGTIVRARAGETVTCPPGEDHWHGASPDTLAVHIALVVASSEYDGTDWLEPVSEATYLACANVRDSQDAP